MKILTTFALSLISFSALALPVLVEPNDYQHRANILYGDHEDENKAYYIPGVGQINMEYGSPFFSMSSMTVSGHFSIKPHDALQVSLMAAEMFHVPVWIMPIKHKFYEFKDTEGMFEKAFDQSELRVDFGHAFNAVLSEKGRNELPELLRTKSDTMNLFSICYEVQGVTPIFGGAILMNPSKVFRHFISKINSKNEYSRAELKNEVTALIKAGHMAIEDNSGDAHLPDYEMVAADMLIEKMFIKDSMTRKFKLSLSTAVMDRVEKTILKGRKEVERVICTDVGVSDLKNYPKLIQTI